MSFEYSSNSNPQSVAVASDLTAGIRVMVRGNPVGITLSSRTGYVVGPDSLWDGFFIIHLDQPATYHHANGETEELAEIREGIDNLILLPE
jgi:hypothetical protein